jgi:hypothetical protein
MNISYLERNKEITGKMIKKISNDNEVDGAVIYNEIQQNLKKSFLEAFIIRYVDGSVKVSTN